MHNNQITQIMFQNYNNCSSLPDFQQFFEKQNINNLSITQNLNENNLQSLPMRQKGKIKRENWQPYQIKKLFHLHSQFGSEWKLIKSQFKDRSSNSIKNRFYTVIRILLKKLFRQHPRIYNKLPHEIPSKTILRFYQGREEFFKMKGFAKKILKTIDYNPESVELKKIILCYSHEIEALYNLIFSQKNKQSKNSKYICKKAQNNWQSATKISQLNKSSHEKREQSNINGSNYKRGDSQDRQVQFEKRTPILGSMMLIPVIDQGTYIGNYGIQYYQYFV